MLTPLIVLANSWKHHDYCIAGINPETGKWVRPVTNLNDGRIPKDAMQLGGYFPKLMDVVEIPLDGDGPDFTFERENRSILPGKWRLAGRASIADLMSFAETPRIVLHNDRRYVTIEDMQRKEFKDRATLQLLHVDNFAVKHRMQVLGKNYWSALIKSGANTINPRITDPVYHALLDTGHAASKTCLTASLTMPWVPPGWKETASPPCWKRSRG